VKRLLKRTAVFLSAAAAIYIVAGSLLFADWWYGFFWDDGFRTSQYVTNALMFLVDNEFWLALGIIAALMVAFVTGALWKRRLFPVTDRFAGLIVFIAFSAVFVDAIVIRHTRVNTYLPSLLVKQAMAKIKDAYGTLELTAAPPKIQPPIYFHYMDSERVEALYNQIIPELQEKQREIKGSTSVKGKLDAGVGDTGISVGAERGRESKSTYDRSNFSSERKCVEVMKYAQDTWPDNYYTTDFDWYWRKLVKQWKEKLNFGERVNPEALRPIPPLPINSDELKRQTEAQNEEWRRELKTELSTIHGWVFVAGDFEKAADGGVVLVEKFSKVPTKSAFKIFLPVKASQGLPTTKPLKLRVFGEIIRPLDTDGFIDVAGVAVF